MRDGGIHEARCWIGPVALAVAHAVSSALAAEPFDLRIDLDNDGVEERLRASEAAIVVEGGSMAGRYSIPEGVMIPAPGARDTALRFIDLNGDKRADLVYADEVREAIHLWTKVVRADLGWAAGWTQAVRVRERPVAGQGVPPLAGAEVRVETGDLVIQRAGHDEVRLNLRELLALPAPPRLSLKDAVNSLRLPEGLAAELVAHEPAVMDPVAFEWGPDGRLWVVEMGDYPTGGDGRGTAGGRIKILRDGDGDGRYETAQVFADGLAFPTGVWPWRQGALVAAAPDILYVADTDGDGRADHREVMFTGFEPGNQQHRFNGFEWGLDGWLYAANGDSGGTVRSLKTGVSLSISGRDVRFRPESGEMETVSGMTQYGLRRDDWGTWFGNNNATWLWQITLPERYLRRNPELAVSSVKNELARYAESTRVFPTSVPMERPNQPWSLNHVTSACSPTPYRDDLLGSGFSGSVFIAEPVHNAVHREVLFRDGAGWQSRRAAGEETREFLTSSDPWFRPVFLRTGPDGALWVADMHRIVLEHPEWISPEMLKRIEVRAGADAGRLYRIAPAGERRRPIPNLTTLDTPGLVEALNSSNGWQRDTAHRLLLEKADPSAIGALRDLLSPANAPEARVQALAVLGALDGLDEAHWQNALADPHPWVRCEALRQSEQQASAALFPAVAALAGDSDPAVRLQTAFSLGAWPAHRSEPVLAALAAAADDTLRAAVLSSVSPRSPLFRQLTDSASMPLAAALPALQPSSSDRGVVLAGYRGLDLRSGDHARGQELFDVHCGICHRLRGRGQAVGPDLDMTAVKPVDWMLAAVLDPAQTVESRYRGWNLTLLDGSSLAGLVAAETVNNLVLRMPGGVERAVLRRDIKKMEPFPGSLMPAGFESAMPPAAMADLLRFVRGRE